MGRDGLVRLCDGVIGDEGVKGKTGLYRGR